MVLAAWTVSSLRAELAAGRTTASALVEQCLAAISAPAGEGARVFTKISETARAEAEASDKLRAKGVCRSPVEGIPISVKDLFDVQGEVTLAGGTALKTRSAAAADAPAIARLRAAGAIIVGRTNMVEYAFGGVGLNPHYGTPRNPYDRDASSATAGRVPGGSSSGAAVSVTDGMCVMGLGSDTRGSVRIPSALCGLTGFKPTQRRVPRDGAFPLSYTLDSVGPLANSVECCAIFDALLAAEGEMSDAKAPEALPVAGLRLLSPKCFLSSGLDAHVAETYARALDALEKQGAKVSTVDAPVLDTAHEVLFANGGFAGPEAYSIHQSILEEHGTQSYDPRVASRVVPGKDVRASDYIQLFHSRKSIIDEAKSLLAPYDALICPTTPMIAPTIAEASASDDAYAAINLKLLRNTGLINALDGCAATVPCHSEGDAPVGLMVAGMGGSDAHILAVARAVEGALAPLRAAADDTEGGGKRAKA